MTKRPSFKQRIKKFFKVLGPGLITGASDDDPSGIATYSQAGAKFGTGLLWTAIITYPLMVAIQEMCAKIGLVTDHGLTGVIKRNYPKPLLYFILIVSMPSIILNIGADIAGMGAVGNLIFPSVSPHIFAILFTGLLLYGTIVWNYQRLSRVLKFLCLTLLLYLFIPFFTNTDWKMVLKDTLIPPISFSSDYLLTLIGILGTTISPYLFFWQTSMEVEEENKRHFVIDKKIIRDMRADVSEGLFLTNIVFYFIVLTTGTVLYKAGIHEINTVDQAALALKPLAGEMSYVMFSLGVLGTGAIAIPVLAGSLSYIMAETFDWQEGLDKKFHQAKGFYITLILSVIVSFLVLFLKINPIKVLFYSAVLYGITAPILIALILHISNNKKIMGDKVNGPLANILGIATLLLMTICILLLIYFQVRN